jgi:hypothetical protein
VNTRIEWLSLVCALALLLFIVELIRKRRLREEYALLWIAATLSIAVMSKARGILHYAAQLAGVYYPPMMLFLAAGFFGMVLAIHYSLVISRLSAENRLLAQDVGLLKLEMDELKRNVALRSRPGLE